MKLDPKHALIALIVAVLGLIALIAIVSDSWRWTMLCVVALQIVTVALIVGTRRERGVDDGAAAALRRIERAIENVSLRTVTEAEATQRDLGGRIDQIRLSLNKES